jgi:hypothetical protein
MLLFYLTQTLCVYFGLYVAVPFEQTQVREVGQGTLTTGEKRSVQLTSSLR